MSKPVSQAIEAGKAAIVATLCVAMSAPQAYAAASIPPPVQAAPLSSQQKTLHALNRLTFGARPGDEAAVKAMGLEKWIQMQLHPETINDSAFDARMNAFPALKLSQEDLIRDFPSPQMLKRDAGKGGKNGGGPFARAVSLPSDPTEHAIYADAMYNYQLRFQEAAANGVAAKAKGAKATDDTMMKDGDTAGGDMADSAMTSPTAGTASAPRMDATTAPKGKGKKPQVDRMQEDDVQAVLNLPPDQRMAKLIAMSPQEMASFRMGVRGPQQLAVLRGLSPAQVETVMAMQSPVRVVGAEALESRMERDVYSERQLQAVMVDFWLNHFSVYARKNQNEPYYLAAYERDTILPNAMGNFENLLVATAKSPAMLTYLDNWLSIGPNSPAASRIRQYSKAAPNAPLAAQLPKGINENYAREIIELHTIGVSCEVSSDHPVSSLAPYCGTGYTQADVTNVAKVLTGWTVDRPYQGGGSFTFETNRHEGGSKQVLGKSIAENGEREGLEVLHMLATSPATAHFISEKLAVRFVSDTPPPALVDRMAATFTKTNGDIKSVLSTMFHSPEFWSPSVYRAKVKTPIEFVASALRASGANVANPLPLVQAMNQLGMPIYGMQTPNGYSWKADQWVSSNALVSRMNFALVLSGSRVPGAKTDWAALLGDSAQSTVAKDPTPATELKLEALILGQPATPNTRSTVLAQFNNPTAQHQAEQSFSLKSSDDDDDNAMAAALPGKNAKGRRGGQGFGFQADQPETPLDTMAGLLLGSPDFQRR